MRGLRFELSACRNTELNFELCCIVRVSAVPKFGECCVARFSSTHSILSTLDFSRLSTTSAVLRWLVMLVLSNLYRCMFIEFYFLSKYSNSIKRLTHKRNGKGCPSAALQEKHHAIAQHCIQPVVKNSLNERFLSNKRGNRLLSCGLWQSKSKKAASGGGKCRMR